MGLFFGTDVQLLSSIAGLVFKGDKIRTTSAAKALKFLPYTDYLDKHRFNGLNRPVSLSWQHRGN